MNFIFKAALSAVIMGAVLLGIRETLPYPSGKALQLAYLALEIVAGCVVYLIMMLILRSQEAIYLVNNIRQRLKM